MFKKLINRSESSQVEINDSALRDIIPSNEILNNTQKFQQKRLSKICKIFILIFILGLVAIGIVVLALVLTFSGKSFMNYIIQSPGEALSNKTRLLINHEENEQNWQKVTVIPIQNNISSTTMKMKDEQLTSTIIQTTQETTTLKTSTFIQKLQTPVTTPIVLKSSTNENKKQILFAQYKKTEEDHMFDDLLYL